MKVIILNGPMGVGKTTVGKYIADQNPGTAFIKRWNNDQNCEWRTDEWLQVSLKSLPGFASMENTIDTSDLLVNQIADLIMR